MKQYQCAAALITTAWLTGCGYTRPVVTDLSQLASGDVIVVGRVKLTPPLDEGEQQKGTKDALVIVPGGFRNKVRLLTGNEWREVSVPPQARDYVNNLHINLDETFYASMPRQTFYFLLGEILMRVGDGPSDSAYLPGGFKISVRDDDRGVYIGTLHYHRDEFFRISSVRAENHYEQALADYQKQFGAGAKLRKSLAKKVDG